MVKFITHDSLLSRTGRHSSAHFYCFIAFRVDKKLIVWSSEYVAYIFHVTSLICNGQTRRKVATAPCGVHRAANKYVLVATWMCVVIGYCLAVLLAVCSTLLKNSVFDTRQNCQLFSINRSIILILNWSVSTDYWRCRSPNVTWPLTRPFINILCCCFLLCRENLSDCCNICRLYYWLDGC